MKLTYRGQTYEYNPPVVEAQDTGLVGGKFRGLDWRFHNLKKAPILQPPVNLTYRGVSYKNNPVAEETKLQVKQKARWLMLNKEKSSRNRDASVSRRIAHEIGLV